MAYRPLLGGEPFGLFPASESSNEIIFPIEHNVNHCTPHSWIRHPEPSPKNLRAMSSSA
jgi:hypothetical protein